MSVSLSISLGGRSRPCSTLVYRKWGSAPSPRARCARRLSAVALFASSSEFVCSYIGGNSLPLLLRGWRYHDPLHWYRLCAVMGTRQRFPEVRTAFGAYPRHLQNVWWVYFVARMGIEGRSPLQKLGHVLAHDMLAFPVSSKARNRKVLRCPSIRLAKARQLRLAFV